MSFRKYQALYDLQSAALELLDSFARDLTPIETSVRQKFVKVSSERVPQWELGLGEDFWTSLVTASCSPEEGGAEFLFATCMLLLDRFENTTRGGDFEWEWDKFSGLYRIAPDAIRAALMNGFEAAKSYSLVSQKICPAPADLATNTTEDVLAPLIALARALTEEEREEIARGNYGCDVGKHLAALDALLETKDCRFPDTWFPAEVVELASYVPDAKGFVGCTALVLINSIYGSDYVDDAEFRWSQNKLAYQNLEMSARGPILVAFRHLYETLPDWNPFWEIFAPDRLPLESYIPWCSERSTNHAKHTFLH